MDFSFNISQVISTFIILFAIIDVLGGIPIFLGVQGENNKINASKASVYSFVILVVFLFVGKWILDLFHVDVESFAVAGALVIFIISLEMILGIEIFKYDSPGASSTLVPVVFPLIAGPGTFTALLSLSSEYSFLNIILGLLINMVIVFVVLKNLKFVEKMLGVGGVFIMRKFFGVILLAISVRLFTVNINALIDTINSSLQ
ncbi:MarC family protein [Dysgonomonas sp. 520]|uniref:MarC family protein n=1 Tax=Dysgonomonas sp. 520 TaxID=2302931 RepID=UPI0013D56C90|nr:MarC family protein [Dysgonomonas sp. 520]NDW08143.1 MarC family protein [Dysgonomonas sp. 520]